MHELCAFQSRVKRRGNTDDCASTSSLNPSVGTDSKDLINDAHEKHKGQLRRTVVSHGTTGMARMEHPTECLGRLISHIENARKMMHNNNTMLTPLLNHVVLDINMARVRSWLPLVDHGDGRDVIFVERCGAILRETEFE
jgi:hypothetical protein